MQVLLVNRTRRGFEWDRKRERWHSNSEVTNKKKHFGILLVFQKINLEFVGNGGNS